MKLVLVTGVLLAACARDASVAARAAEDTPAQCSDATAIAALPAQLQEASGVAVSIRHPGILWAHNDSGEPVLFALDTLGNVRARVRLPVTNSDWEDIEVARCPEGSCIYLGAIGDNRQNRSDRAVLRFPEPDLASARLAQPTRFRYRLPDAPQDMEALFALPDGRMFLLTKGRSGPITLYAFPEQPSPSAMNDLIRIQLLSPGLVQLPDMITGAGATPDGTLIVIRSYSAFQLYTLDENQLNPALPQAGYDLEGLREFQGEGADISESGVVYLVSEKGLGDEDPALSKVKCSI